MGKLENGSTLMENWYHSGIEGYCKASARLMGLPDNNSGWGNFGRDLFNDGRFDDPVKSNRTWTLSRFRHLGRANRPTLFEKSWLGTSGPDCEIDAVHICVRSICSDETPSTLATLLQEGHLKFADGFRLQVLPAIRDGFLTERYHSADVVRFMQGIEGRLDELRPNLPQTFRNLAIPLVAGLIYGPGHLLAQTQTRTATVKRRHAMNIALSEHISLDTGTARITQLFGDDNSYTGYSELFFSSQAVFFGRNTSNDEALEKCDPAFAAEIADRQIINFPIADTHKSTSKAHGILARLGDMWYFHDFSTNGSYIKSADGSVQEVHGAVACVHPGDTLCLGMTEPDLRNDIATYLLATSLRISFDVNESTLT